MEQNCRENKYSEALRSGVVYLVCVGWILVPSTIVLAAGFKLASAEIYI
jgi:hypothetical protein